MHSACQQNNIYIYIYIYYIYISYIIYNICRVDAVPEEVQVLGSADV